MINAILRSMIGSWGNWLLDQYIANALWINGLILTYALLVALARCNFKKTLLFFLTHLETQHARQLKGKNKQQMTRFLSHISLPWQKALCNTRFPVISPPNSIRLYANTEATLKKFFGPETIAEAITQPQVTQEKQTKGKPDKKRL